MRGLPDACSQHVRGPPVPVITDGEDPVPTRMLEIECGESDLTEAHSTQPRSPDESFQNISPMRDKFGASSTWPSPNLDGFN
jgi:hypothetical protein